MVFTIIVSNLLQGKNKLKGQSQNSKFMSSEFVTEPHLITEFTIKYIYTSVMDFLI